jgi:hypothetical protein
LAAKIGTVGFLAGELLPKIPVLLEEYGSSPPPRATGPALA